MSDKKMSSAKDEAELNKYFFDLEKHITTLDTGLIAFLSTVAAGLVDNSKLTSIPLGLAFLFLMISIVFSVISMHSIADIAWSGKGYLNSVNIFVTSSISLIAFLLGLSCVIVLVFFKCNVLGVFSCQ